MTKLTDLEVGDTIRYRCALNITECGCTMDPDDGNPTHESDVAEVFEVALGIMDCELENGYSPTNKDFENGAAEVV